MSKEYGELGKTKRMVASEVFTSGVCNLDCDYCYIPKNKEMEKYHKKIIEKIESGEYVDLLFKVYGEDLRNLGLWGTEPTLVLDSYVNNIDLFLDKFPKLSTISFSTNLYRFPEKIVELSDRIDEYLKGEEREFELRWQVSIDGPKWITDEGRGEGVTESIQNNLVKYFNMLKERDYNNINIVFDIKPTVAVKYMEMMNDNFDKLREWYEFFNNIIGELRGLLRDINDLNVRIPNSVRPTIVMPGKYNSYEGKEFGRFIKNIYKLEMIKVKNEEFLNNLKLPYTPYEGHIKGLIENSERISNMPYINTCSGADSNFGLNLEENLHICHRTFLFDNKKYVNEVLNPDTHIDEWDVSKFKEGVIENVNKYLIPNINNDREKLRFFYTTRAYHDSLSLRVSNSFAMIKELARVGQVSDIYLEDDKLSILLSLFLNEALTCPMENYLQSGSLHLQPVSLLRFFGNGAFERILKGYIDRRGDI